MARRRIKKRSAAAARGRDISKYNTIARRQRILNARAIAPVLPPRRRPRVVPIQDRRLFSPVSRPVRRIDGRPVEFSVPSSKGSVSPFLGFTAPRTVTLCVRRHRRREVMFATGRAGRRGLGLHKRRRTNEYSHVRC